MALLVKSSGCWLLSKKRAYDDDDDDDDEIGAQPQRSHSPGLYCTEVQNDTPPVKALEMTLIHRITTEPVSNFAVVRPTTCIFKDWFLRPFLYR